MKLYVGYIIGSYPIPLVASADRDKVKKFLRENTEPSNAPYIEEYDINNLIKL